MNNLIPQIVATLENIKITDGDFEFWRARDLMPVLQYATWQKFSDAIKRAEIACEKSGQRLQDHFLPAPVKSTGGRPRDDIYLTRYACYLIAQNGDPRKQQIALAQSYFASQTRKQELHEKKSLEDKRLAAREKLKQSEAKIEETVYERGIRLPVEFATFKNKKIETLYNMSVKALKQKRGIPEHRALADFDSEVELKAKDFIYAMTDHNIKTKNIVGKSYLEQEVISNAKATRSTLLNRGIVPEDIPPEEDLKIIATRRKKEMLNISETPKKLPNHNKNRPDSKKDL